MSLVRDMPFVVRGLKDTIFVTCAAVYTSAASTAAVGLLSAETTAGALNSGTAETTAYGRVINRLRLPQGATKYDACVVGSWLHSTRGSTEADRKISIGVKLQHGDSSGGGDMADYSADNQPADKVYFSSARSTDHASWDASESTGELYAASNPGYYDLRAAKQYIRVAVPVFKNRVTTESSGDEQCRVGADIVFAAARNVPFRADTTSPYSTSTST